MSSAAAVPLEKSRSRCSEVNDAIEGVMSGPERRQGPGPGLMFGVMGGFLIGEAVLLFVSSNWRAIPDGVKLAMIFGNLIAAYLLADRFRFGRSPRHGVAAGLFLKGAIGYGAGVFLIGQIYNFHADWRTGLLYWLAGTLPLAYVVDSRPLLGLSLGTAVLWLAAGFDYWSPELDLLLPLLGAILILCGVLHWDRGRVARFAGIYVIAGASLVLASTFLLGDWDSSQRIHDTPSFGAHLRSLTAGSAALLLAGLFLPSPSFQRALRLITAFVPVALLPTFYVALTDGSEGQLGDAFFVGVKLLLLVECLGLVLFGWAVHARGPVRLGLVFFGLIAGWEFFNDRWDYLARAAVFAGVGLVLLACGYWAERARRGLAPARGMPK